HTATPQPYTLSLHDALPIYSGRARPGGSRPRAPAPFHPPDERSVTHLELEDARRAGRRTWGVGSSTRAAARELLAVTRCANRVRSEEHTSELQSRFDLVCRL